MVNVFPVTVTPPERTCHSWSPYPKSGSAVSVICVPYVPDAAEAYAVPFPLAETVTVRTAAGS